MNPRVVGLEDVFGEHAGHGRVHRERGKELKDGNVLIES